MTFPPTLNWSISGEQEDSEFLRFIESREEQARMSMARISEREEAIREERSNAREQIARIDMTASEQSVMSLHNRAQNCCRKLSSHSQDGNVVTQLTCQYRSGCRIYYFHGDQMVRIIK